MARSFKLHDCSALPQARMSTPSPSKSPSAKSISDVVMGAMASKLTSRRPTWMERPDAYQTPPPKKSRVADQSPPPSKIELHIPQPEPNIKSQASTEEAVFAESDPEEPEELELSCGVMEELMTHAHLQGSNAQVNSYGSSDGQLLCTQDHIPLSLYDSPHTTPIDDSGSEREYGDIVPEVRPQGQGLPSQGTT